MAEAMAEAMAVTVVTAVAATAATPVAGWEHFPEGRVERLLRSRAGEVAMVRVGMARVAAVV